GARGDRLLARLGEPGGPGAVDELERAQVDAHPAGAGEGREEAAPRGLAGCDRQMTPQADVGLARPGLAAFDLERVVHGAIIRVRRARSEVDARRWQGSLRMAESKRTKGYLHGFTPEEQDRL